MRNIKNTCIFSLALILSCNNIDHTHSSTYSNTPKVKMHSDSTRFYFSTFEPFDSSQEEFVKDTFWQDYLSTNLYALREPIFQNAYSGYDQYRFLWLRSFHLPMVFVISNIDEKITLTVKKLDRQPLFHDNRYVGMDDVVAYYAKMGCKIVKEIDTLKNGRIEVVTVVKADRKANIIFDSTILLTKENWNRFEKLLDKVSYWRTTPYYWEGSTDGALWLIEANTKKGYRYIIRQSPGDSIRTIGETLISLSGVKEEIY